MMGDDPVKARFTKVPNGLLERLARTNLSPYEARTMMVVIRYTLGYRRLWAPIPLSAFEKETALPRTNIHRALKALTRKAILARNRSEQRVSVWGIHPDVLGSDSISSDNISTHDQNSISSDTLGGDTPNSKKRNQRKKKGKEKGVSRTPEERRQKYLGGKYAEIIEH